MSTPRSREAAYFEQMYRQNPDPWQFESSPYEQAKYDATLHMLDGRRFVSALEIGCSIGVLTRRLAVQCDAVLGLDIAEAPLVQARARCADQPWVRFEQGAVPAAWPHGRFDLIVLSEVLYFLSRDDIEAVAAKAMDCVRHSGHVLLVNWLGHADNPCGGDEAALTFIETCDERVRVAQSKRTAEYRLDLLVAH
jgi:2-polyprenyl-3-methyl-5-hydroxy-6-metoxy-1,4-benzoquinol methylase